MYEAREVLGDVRASVGEKLRIMFSSLQVPTFKVISICLDRFNFL